MDCVNDIEVDFTLLDITRDVWNGTLSWQDLGHVIVLYICQWLSVVFGTSAAQIMEVINKGVNPSMHDHELNLGHLLACIARTEVFVEEGLKYSGDHCALALVQSI